MRKLLFSILMLGIVALAGCATMTQSGPEVRNTYKRVWSYELKQMSDDWNFVWQVDRPSRLTRWQMR